MSPSPGCGILAGGASSRMGVNKALLPFRGRPLIATQIEILAPLFRSLSIGANDPALYAEFKLPVVPDVLPERCALTGIHALARAAGAGGVFVVACDLPHLNPSLIRMLLSHVGGWDALIPESDRGLEPLHAYYGAACVPAFEAAGRKGEWRVSAALEGLKVQKIRIHDATWQVEGRSPFFNANTPEEWRAAKA